MAEHDFEGLFARCDGVDDPDEASSVTRLLRLAAALNDWDYPCVTKIECGYSVQDAHYVGDIELLLADSRGCWQVTVRPSCWGEMITFLDPNQVVDQRREKELERIFADHGYIYVPHAVARNPYPGDEFATWFDRFFS
jgi:hypothetical protein